MIAQYEDSHYLALLGQYIIYRHSCQVSDLKGGKNLTLSVKCETVNMSEILKTYDSCLKYRLIDWLIALNGIEFVYVL